MLNFSPRLEILNIKKKRVRMSSQLSLQGALLNAYTLFKIS